VHARRGGHLHGDLAPRLPRNVRRTFLLPSLSATMKRSIQSYDALAETRGYGDGVPALCP